VTATAFFGGRAAGFFFIAANVATRRDAPDNRDVDSAEALARPMPWLAVAALAGVFVVGVGIVLFVVMSGRRKRPER
jgi:formate hydrogenlyase subunit 3/multisubunit Na+/H+ antiporter MnhD subunit